MLVLGAFIFSVTAHATALQFEVSLKSALVSSPQSGRLFVILARTNQPEPRATLARAGLDAPYTLARDVSPLAPGATVLLDSTAFTFPITNLSDLPAGDYFIQALLDSNRDLRSPNSPRQFLQRCPKTPPRPRPSGRDQTRISTTKSRLNNCRPTPPKSSSSKSNPASSVISTIAPSICALASSSRAITTATPPASIPSGSASAASTPVTLP